MYDVIVIGAGVSGAACARSLSRYKLQICVLEKEEDVCCQTSKANSGIVHAGFDAPSGSLMARLNLQGNRQMETLAQQLDFPFKRNGSLVVCMDKEDFPALQKLYNRGISNGVPELKILNKKDLMQQEPAICDSAYGALYAPTGGIVCPFGLNIALAENAAVNGVNFLFNTEVRSVRKNGRLWELDTSGGTFQTRCVVNAAGVYADILHNQVSRNKIQITPRRGEYCLLDRSAGNHVRHTVFSLPGKLGKGVLVTPTVHGNLLLGPTAEDITDKEATNTTREGLNHLIFKTSSFVKDIPFRKTITSFAGLRAHESRHDFIIQELPDAEGFIDCAGIASPGLTSAPAIGDMVAGIIQHKFNAEKKSHFLSARKGILNPKSLSKEAQAALIRKNPAYGNVVCRCEAITEGEILDAIHRPLGAKSLDGIKRRTRAGMGRCQSGFCSLRIMEILSEELNVNMCDVTKSGRSSHVIAPTDRHDK